MTNYEELVDLLITLTEHSAQKDNRPLIEEILKNSNLSPSEHLIVDDIVSNHTATLRDHKSEPVVIYDSKGRNCITISEYGECDQI